MRNTSFTSPVGWRWGDLTGGWRLGWTSTVGWRLGNLGRRAVGVSRTTRPAVGSVAVLLELTLIGGPTAVLAYGGVRWLTDPTFSPPGEYAGGLVKTTPPALSPDQVEPIDVVLISHDQHSDNLDPAGREFLSRAGRVLTTVEGAQRLGGNSTGLEPWSSSEVVGSDGVVVTVTAVPARHGPAGSEPVTGPVIGFALSAPGLESVYISGDNASLEVVQEVGAQCGPFDVAVLFAGAVQLPHRFDGAYLTLSSDLAAQAAIVLGAPTVIPLHFEGWTHFTQGANELRAAFAGNGVADRLVMPTRGNTVSVPHAPDTA